MKWMLALVFLGGLACSISPVVTPPAEGGGDRYYDCRRAARDYCRDALHTSEDEMKKCVAEATFQCLSAARP